MKKVTLSFVLLLISAVYANAFWPFGKDEATVRSEKILAILREPSTIIEEAEIAMDKKEADRAISLYRKAYQLLQQVEREYDTQSTDFAALRLKKYQCESMIDTILLAQASVSDRRHAVTDTSELEKKLAELRKKDDPNEKKNDENDATADEPLLGDVKVKEVLPLPKIAKVETVVKPAETVTEKVVETEVKPPETTVEEEIAWIRELWSMKKIDQVEAALIVALNRFPENDDLTMLLAQLRLTQERFSDAIDLANCIEIKSPLGASAKMLVAGAFMGLRQPVRAMDTLGTVLENYPNQPAAYFNMSVIMSDLPKQKQQAILYYKKSVELGGSRNELLERKFNMK